MRARKRFEFISEYSSRWPVSVMCDVLHVSETVITDSKGISAIPARTLFFRQLYRKYSMSIYYNDNYGVDRMQIALRNLGYKVGKRRIARIMKENGWLHERKRRPKGLYQGNY